MKKIRTVAPTHICHTHSTQYITAPGRTRRSCTTAATHTLNTIHHCPRQDSETRRAALLLPPTSVTLSKQHTTASEVRRSALLPPPMSHTHSIQQYTTASGRTQRQDLHCCHHPCLSHPHDTAIHRCLRSSALLLLLMQPVSVTNTPVTQTTSLPQSDLHKLNWLLTTPKYICSEVTSRRKQRKVFHIQQTKLIPNKL